MKHRGFAGVGAGFVPTAALAECTSGGCYDGLIALAVTAVFYLLLAIVLLVMLLRAKWRKAGFQLLAVALLLAVGVPLISQAWHGWSLRAMTAREAAFAGTLPSLMDRQSLLLNLSENCQLGPCEAVLFGAGARGVLALGPAALAALDLSQPLDLASLPIERWVADVNSETGVRVTPATAAERASVDYLLITAYTYYLSQPGPMEAALDSNPALEGIGGNEVLRLAMAPLAKGALLDLATLRFDLVDLWFVSSALAVPLAPGNAWSPRNGFVRAEDAALAICPTPDGSLDYSCLAILQPP